MAQTIGPKISKRKKARCAAFAGSLLLVLALGGGGAAAFLLDATDAITNRFTPSKVTTAVVESLDGATKSDVKIRNTGDTAAWLRAAVVITWQDAAGNVYGQTPVEGVDYTIAYDLQHGWLLGSDGFYYWSAPVDAGGESGVLIVSCAGQANVPEDYGLCVEILGSGIQSRPAAAFGECWASSGLCVTADGNSLVKQGGG